jgi:hypothetical protein
LAYLTRKEYWVMDGLTHSAGIVRTFKCVRFTEKIIRGEDLKPPSLGLNQLHIAILTQCFDG